MESAGLFLDDYPNNFTSDNGTVSFISSTFGVTSSVSSSLSSSLSSVSPVSSTASASIDSTLAGSAYSGSLDALGSNLGSTLQPDTLFTLVDSSLDQPPCSPAALLELKLRNDPLMLLSVISLVIINLAVIAGNILVIVAVTISSKLRTITNFFIVSLAVADLLLGLTVAPYALALTVLDVWIFGEIWCLGWLVIDVWLSTASILNLCAISVDRYLAVTRPVRYRTMMTSKRAKMIIAFVWILSFIVSFPPLLGWNDTGSIIAQGQHDNDSSKMMVATTYDGSRCYWKPNQCVLFDNTGYVTYSALGSFYIPMSFMMFFYWRIYIVASRTTRALKRGYKTTKTGDSETDGSSDKRLTLRMHRGYICEDTGSNASSETPSLMSSLSTDVYNCHQLHPIHGHSHAHHHNIHHSHSHSHAQHHHHSSHHDYTNNHNHQVNCTSFMKTSPKLAKSFFSPSKLQGYNNRVDDNNNSPSEMSNISNVNNNNNFNNLNDTNNSHSNNSSNNPGSANINSCESHFGNNLVVPKFTPGNANAGSGSGSGGGKDRRKTPITVYRSPRLQVNSMTLEGSGSCCEADGQKRRSTCSLASSCSGLTSFTGVESSPSHTRDSGRSNASKSVRFSRRTNTGKWQTRRLLAETKAAKTVGIIVGGFIICWFPFFTIYLIRGYCHDQNCVPKLLLTIFTWLGYTNSAVNPIIYGLFSRDFRRAFKNIICKCKYSEETGVTSLIRQIHLPNLFEEDNHDDCMKTDSQEDVH